MKVLIVYKPSVIRLRGDKEREAVANYMYNRYGKVIIDRTFAANMLCKYHGEAVLHEHNGIKFYYPKFN